MMFLAGCEPTGNRKKHFKVTHSVRNACLMNFHAYNYTQMSGSNRRQYGLTKAVIFQSQGYHAMLILNLYKILLSTRHCSCFYFVFIFLSHELFTYVSLRKT